MFQVSAESKRQVSDYIANTAYFSKVLYNLRFFWILWNHCDTREATFIWTVSLWWVWTSLKLSYTTLSRNYLMFNKYLNKISLDTLFYFQVCVLCTNWVMGFKVKTYAPFNIKRGVGILNFFFEIRILVCLVRHFPMLERLCFYSRVLTSTISSGPTNGRFLIHQIKYFLCS